MAFSDKEFIHSGLFEYRFSTEAGEVGLLAEVAIEGEVLLLKDVAIYSTGLSEILSIGPGSVLHTLHILENLARTEGYKQLRIEGMRLTGASPGKLVRIRRELQPCCS